jgi:hypothetical protein
MFHQKHMECPSHFRNVGISLLCSSFPFNPPPSVA